MMIMCIKNDKYVHSELYGSAGASNKCANFLLKGEWQLRVKCSIYSPEGRIHNVMY